MLTPCWWRRLPRPSRNAGIYVFESGTRTLVLGVTGVLIARHLGPGSFGLLNYAVGIMGVAVPIASLGLRPILVREISTTTDWRPLIAAAALHQSVAGFILALAGSGLIALSRPTVPEAPLIALALFPLPLLAVGDTFRALIEVRGQSRLLLRASISATILGAALKLAAIDGSAPLWVFASITSLEALFLVLGLAWRRLTPRSLVSLRHFYSPAIARALVRESWPVLVSSVAVILYMRIDVTMLGLMVGDQATGIYAAAVRLSEAWYFVPVAAAAGVRPRLARLYKANQLRQYEALTQKLLTIALVTAIVGAVMTLMVADTLVLALFGSAFADSESVLRIHVFAAPFVFIGVAAAQWLIDRNLTQQLMRRSLAGLAVNIALNLLLIPRLGAPGAAWSTLVSYAVATVLMNAVEPSTRPLFVLQMRAAMGRMR